jgi:hypothetical protein
MLRALPLSRCALGRGRGGRAWGLDAGGVGRQDNIQDFNKFPLSVAGCVKDADVCGNGCKSY